MLLLGVGVAVSQMAAWARRLKAVTVSNGQYVGRFMLTPKPGARPSQRARLVAVAHADLAGHAVGDGSAHAA